jgi:hypothetical protein
VSGTVETGSGASHALLAAALSGLLSLASAACGASGASAAASAASTETTNGDTPIPATACDGGVSPNPTVTSSTVAALTLGQFTSQCNTLNGIVETQPHCGGSNACRGMSYDTETQSLSEHTCRATNTCAGYSCVVCD